MKLISIHSRSFTNYYLPDFHVGHFPVSCWFRLSVSVWLGSSRNKEMTRVTIASTSKLPRQQIYFETFHTKSSTKISSFQPHPRGDWRAAERDPKPIREFQCAIFVVVAWLFVRIIQCLAAPCWSSVLCLKKILSFIANESKIVEKWGAHTLGNKLGNECVATSNLILPVGSRCGIGA